MRRILGILVLVMAIVSRAQAQDGSPGNPPDDFPDSFLELADLRGALNADIMTLEREIKGIESGILEASTRRSILEQLRERISGLDSQPSPTPEQQRQLSELREQAADLEAELRSNPVDQGALQSKKDLLLQKKSQAARVQEKIASMLSPEQVFKRNMSITFAFLIGLVIVGFFGIALKDERVRRAIFAGQAGMQFITLFSVVIAIILFGITGILEGKELAALLGGLSGYILGRVTTSPPPAFGQRERAPGHERASER